MRLLIGQASLLKVLAIAQGVVPRRTTKPILMNLLLQANFDKGLTISATDDELSFVGSTEAQVETPGQIVVAAKDLYDVVRNMPERSIELIEKPEENMIELKCGNIDFHLQTMSADEFPHIPHMEPASSVAYSASELSRLIDRTIFAVSQEETRYYLGGVFLECKEREILRAVATDGHRLALAEAPAPEGFLLSPGQILPRKLLGELRKILEAKQGDVRFGFQDRRVMFQYGPQTLMSLLVEGSFPDYRQVVPKSPNITCRVGRVELLEALRRISLLSPEKTGGVRFTLQDRRLTLSSQHTGRGKGKQEVDIREGGGVLEVGFNAKYFIDGLQAIETADVLLEFTNHLSPCLLRPYHDDAKEDNTPRSTQVNVVMPMRL